MTLPFASGNLSRPDSPFDPNSGVNPVGPLGTQPPISTPVVLTGVKAQTGINQLRGSTVAGSTGIGIPKQVTNVSVNMSNASKGSTSLLTVTFQRDPSDKSYAGVVVYVKGYQGNQTPTQVASGTDSPLNVVLNNTGESISLVVQAIGNAGSAPLATAPSTGLTLPQNVSGGFGTSTSTNLTSSQVQQIAGGGASAVLSFGIVTAQPANLNLTTDGTFDWCATDPGNAGLNNDSLTQNLRWKRSNGELARCYRNLAPASNSHGTNQTNIQGLTSNFGQCSLSATAGDEGADDADGFAGVNNRAPMTNAFAVRGLYLPFGTDVGYGFSLASYADTTLRTLKLYLGQNPNTTSVSMTTRIIATLQDGSAPQIQMDRTYTTGGSSPYDFYMLPISFRAKTGCKLVVTITMISTSGASGNAEVDFVAATVS